MQFVVHYHFSNTDYSELKALTDNQYERLIEAKEIRLASTSENQHFEQRNPLPADGLIQLDMGFTLTHVIKNLQR